MVRNIPARSHHWHLRINPPPPGGISLYFCVEEIGVKYLWSRGDSLLHVGIAANRVPASCVSRDAEITRREIRTVGRVVVAPYPGIKPS
jgi:hypothetical protein